MKWQQRVRVATGLSCWQIMLHLLVVAVLVMGWISGALVRVGLGLCVLYSVTLLAMLFLQRHHEARWRDVGDFLEELTTTWYFGAAMIALWLLSRVLHNNLLLALAGLVILAGPAVVSLLAKDKSRYPKAFGLQQGGNAANPRSIDNYATGVSKESQRRCSLNDDGYYAIFLRNIAYAAEPVVAAMTSSGHKLPHTISRLASFR